MFGFLPPYKLDERPPRSQQKLFIVARPLVHISEVDPNTKKRGCNDCHVGLPDRGWWLLILPSYVMLPSGKMSHSWLEYPICSIGNIFFNLRGPHFPGIRYVSWSQSVQPTVWDPWFAILGKFFLGTPWKINMEPTNHPFWKENDLPNLHDYVPC